MKKIIESRMLQLCCMLVPLLFAACEKDDMDAPVITGVRNYAETPDDSLLQSLQPGQWVVLTGHHLTGATQIIFNGVPTSFNSSLFSDSYAVVQVPAVIPFPIIPADQQNTIQYVTDHGATIFSFSITAPAPVITAISNENAHPGEVVYIYGTNLFLLTGFSYARTEITEYTSSPDGTFLSFVLPELNEIGPVVVENSAGVYATVFSINDTTGILCNFDNVNTMSWGTGTSDNGADFPGNKGWFAQLKHNGYAAGKNQWWELGINTQDDVEWIPAEDTLTALIDEYALKFEVNVPKKWEGTSFYIVRGYEWEYLARFEPWKVGNEVVPFTTSGRWTTVTIPLTAFRTDNGTGVSAPSMRELFQGSFKINKSFNMWAMNETPEAVPAMDVAIDNIRVVKIR